jgi:hypothetical protein
VPEVAFDSVTYAERWSDLVPGPVDDLDDEQARQRHESGELYTAILSDGFTPRAYLEVRLEVGFVAVHFLDDERRNHVTYVFGREKGEDQLFLQRATWREFGADSQVARGQTFYFKRDGTIYLEEKDYERREATRGEKQDDVSGNWELVPAFGRYESIARLER